MKNKQWVLNIVKHEKRMYSQSTEDGALDYIFKHLRTKNRPPFYAELGFQHENNANTTYLRKHLNWNGVLFDCDRECPQINLYKHHITSDNICKLFAIHNVPKEPEYVSIDLDSCDLWVFEAILEEYRPMVISCEYNCFFSIDRAITIVNDKTFRWEGDNVYGASLKALNIVANKFGYSLIYIAWYNDACFIRNDLIKSQDIPIFNSFSDRCGIPNFLGYSKNGREKYFMDYEEYLNNGNDVEKAQEKASDFHEKLKSGPHKLFLGHANPFNKTTGEWMDAPRKLKAGRK